MVELDGYIHMRQANDIIGHLHHGIQERDIDEILDCYDEKAEIQIFDQDNPPDDPMIVRGKGAIRAYFEDRLQRNLSHTLEAKVVSENYIAFTEQRRYVDGMRMVASDMCEVSGGKICKQMTVQVWG